jgi:hypothetical protein
MPEQDKVIAYANVYKGNRYVLHKTEKAAKINAMKSAIRVAVKLTEVSKGTQSNR